MWLAWEPSSFDSSFGGLLAIRQQSQLQYHVTFSLRFPWYLLLVNVLFPAVLGTYSVLVNWWMTACLPWPVLLHCTVYTLGYPLLTKGEGGLSMLSLSMLLLCGNVFHPILLLGMIDLFNLEKPNRKGSCWINQWNDCVITTGKGKLSLCT